MGVIYKKELKSYFTSMTGYVFIAFIMLVIGIYSAMVNFQQGYGGFEYVIYSIDFIFLIVVPILTMRVIAEERRQRTDQLLYSLPISMTQVVLGKYLAMLTVLAVPVVICCAYPIVLGTYGTVEYGTAYSSIVGFFFMGAGLIAIGMFLSSLTDNQIIAAVLCFGAILVNYLLSTLASYVPKTAVASLAAYAAILLLCGVAFYMLTKNLLVSGAVTLVGEGALIAAYFINTASFEGSFIKIMSSLSLFDGLYDFVYGAFNICTLVFFISVCFVFIVLTVQAMEKRRWS